MLPKCVLALKAVSGDLSLSRPYTPKLYLTECAGMASGGLIMPVREPIQENGSPNEKIRSQRRAIFSAAKKEVAKANERSL